MTYSVTACIVRLTVEVIMAVQDVGTKSVERSEEDFLCPVQLACTSCGCRDIQQEGGDHVHVTIPCLSARVQSHRTCCLTFQEPQTAANPPAI
jgi:hypothetical protein